jgi:hypothetical protein
MTGFLSGDTRAALERLLADSPGTDPLTRVRDIRKALASLEDDGALLEAIREADASWDDIAAAAGLGVAAAKWRWQGTDAEIADRHESGRKRSARPSSIPTDLPGYSVAEAAAKLNVTAQAIYLRVSRGQLRSETVTLPDGRSYKRVFPEALTE